MPLHVLPDGNALDPALVVAVIADPGFNCGYGVRRGPFVSIGMGGRTAHTIYFDTFAKACAARDDLVRAVNAAVNAPAPPPAATRGVYVASRASLPGRAAMWRGLRVEGWPIVSTWIDEDGPGQTDDLGELWTRIVAEVTGSAGVVLYAEAGDFPLKGALVEVGAALAAGLPVVVVAPDVDIDPRSCRPIGSWMRHPLVGREASAVDAFRRLGVTVVAGAPCPVCFHAAGAPHAPGCLRALVDAMPSPPAAAPEAPGP